MLKIYIYKSTVENSSLQRKFIRLRVAMRIKFLIISLMISSCAVAGERSFNCTVNGVYSLSSNGKIEIESSPAVPRVKDTFSVDRRSGVVVGERIPVFRPDKFLLLAAGTDGNSFVVSYSAKTQVGFLIIESYRESKRVPFLLQDGIWISSGVCD